MRHALKQATGASVGILLVGLVWGGMHYSNPSSPNWNPNDYAMIEIWAVAVIPLALCVFAWGCVLGKWILGQASVATVHVPTPQEIYVHLEAQLGRPPTVMEVESLHTMLRAQRNEAAVKTAAGASAVLLLGHGPF